MSEASHEHGHDDHKINILGCFIFLLAFTAGEYALYELNHKFEFLAKHVLVLAILALTIPKAALVMSVFMHLKFEKFLVVMIALVPLSLVAICVLPTLTDIRTLSGNDMTMNHDDDLGDFVVSHGDHGAGHGDEGGHGATHEASHDDHADEAGSGDDFGGDDAFGSDDPFGGGDFDSGDMSSDDGAADAGDDAAAEDEAASDEPAVVEDGFGGSGF